MEIKPTLFPTYDELNRTRDAGNFTRLYENKHLQVLGLHDMIKKQYKKEKDIVYLAHNLPSYVSDFYADFVAGDPTKLIIRGNSGIKEVDNFVEETVYENDLIEKVTDIATEQSVHGYVPLIGYIAEDQTFHIDQVECDQYFPQKDGDVVFVTYKKIKNGLLAQEAMYAFAQKYSKKTGHAQVERSYWKCNSLGVFEAKLAYTEGQQLYGHNEAVLEIEDIVELVDDIPVRQIDNTKRHKNGYGKSDYADIMPQIAEVNERATQNSTQFLKNLNSLMTLPASMFDAEGKPTAFDAIKLEKDDQAPTYVSNSNPLLADAREHILDQIRIVSLITGVPMWALLKNGQPEQVESLRIQLFNAVRRTERKRQRIVRALNDMFRIGFKMKGIEYDKDIDIVFSDVLPKDPTVTASVEQVKVTTGLSSRRSAIMRLENVSAEEAQAEIDQINAEDRTVGFIQPPQA